LVRVERSVDLGDERCVLTNAWHDGAHDDGGFNDEAARAIGGDNHAVDAFEKLPDADPASIVDIKDYGLRFHDGYRIPPGGNVYRSPWVSAPWGQDW
jgi:hypothetical protein